MKYIKYFKENKDEYYVKMNSNDSRPNAFPGDEYADDLTNMVDIIKSECIQISKQNIDYIEGFFSIKSETDVFQNMVIDLNWFANKKENVWHSYIEYIEDWNAHRLGVFINHIYNADLLNQKKQPRYYNNKATKPIYFYELKDEYFIVYFCHNNSFYKCDQIDGVLELLKDQVIL